MTFDQTFKWIVRKKKSSWTFFSCKYPYWILLTKFPLTSFLTTKGWQHSRNFCCCDVAKNVWPNTNILNFLLPINAHVLVGRISCMYSTFSSWIYNLNLFHTFCLKVTCQKTTCLKRLQMLLLSWQYTPHTFCQANVVIHNKLCPFVWYSLAVKKHSVFQTFILIYGPT